MRPRNRKIVLFSILAFVLALVFLDPVERQDADVAPILSQSGSNSKEAGENTQPRKLGLVLPEHRGLSEAGLELFVPQSWQPPPPKVASVPVKPTAPPLPYRFAGRLLQEGRLQIFLSRGDAAIPVKQGEILDGAYRVESIAEDEVTLTYLPLNHKEIIPVSSTLQTAGGPVPAAGDRARAIAAASVIAAADAPAIPRREMPAASASDMKADSRPAQLLWQGPQQVKLGSRFSVALRVTSEQPVRASPMQFKFDPSLLETVEVKPGRFFSQGDRNFSYRVNLDGTIFVGASNPGPSSAADAEFLVLTFRPLKPAPAAELSIASLNLQGASGRPIAFDQLTAFKTAITP